MSAMSLNQADYNAEVSRRVQEVLHAVVERGGTSIWTVHAHLALGGATADVVSEAVEKHLGGSTFASHESVAAGPFHVLPAMMLLCRWEAQLPERAIGRIRELFLHGCIDRGNTENHWLMHYTGCLLAAERFNDAPSMWNGLSPSAVASEAKRWILGMTRRSVAVGHHEYDSTGYVAEHVTPLIALEQFSKDREVRDAARKMLTLHFTDMALEYFHGAWAGSHSREGYRVNTWTKSGTVRGFHFVYFGGEELDPASHVQGFVVPDLVTEYRPSVLVIAMAFERSRPFVVKKTKAPRTIYRHVDRDAAQVRKYTYLSPSFALGSAQLGLPGTPAGPIDLTSWDLTWDGPKHQAKVVCNHPFRDPRRFSAFLSMLPQVAERDVATGKPYLQYPDRLFGASPYERIMQHEGTAIVLYRIPSSDRDPYVNLYLPKGLSWVEESGWLFADVANHEREEAPGFYLAVRPIGGYVWQEIREATTSNIMVTDGDLIDGWLLRIPSRHAGLVLDAVERTEVPSFVSFIERRVFESVDLVDWPSGGIVRYRTAAGADLEMHYAGLHIVDGTPIDYGSWPLYEAPWVSAPLGSGRIDYVLDTQRMCLEFDLSNPLIPIRSVG